LHGTGDPAAVSAEKAKESGRIRDGNELTTLLTRNVGNRFLTEVQSPSSQRFDT
jgi:hypothetical protein